MSKKDKGNGGQTTAEMAAGAVADQLMASGGGELIQPPIAESNGKPDETKAEKFIRLAVVRVNHTLARMRQIRNLANTQNYVYTQDQAKAIIVALSQELDEVAAAFAGHDDASEGFTF